MGLINGKCDSCGNKTDVLFPIAILEELCSGGEAMVIKYYCLTCRESVEDEAESTEPDKETPPPPSDEEPKGCLMCPDRVTCGVFGDCRKKHYNDKDLP